MYIKYSYNNKIINNSFSNFNFLLYGVYFEYSNDNEIIKMPTDYDLQNVTISLYDIRGRSIFISPILRNNSIQINNLNKLSTGSYLLKILNKTNSKEIIKKLIKN